MKFTEFGKSIMDWRKHHWFFTPESLDSFVGRVQAGALYHPIHGRDLMLGKLMLAVTEVSEMDEADDHANYREEMADTAIRILDITAALNIDIDGNLKMVESEVIKQMDIMGVVNQLSAAAECVRKDNVPGLAMALARAFRLLLLFSAGDGFDLMAEMEKKMSVNWKRPIKHGKLCSL